MDVDDYFVWDEKVENLESFFTKLRPDCVFVTSPNSFALAGSFLSRVKLIVVPRVEGGFCPTQTKLYKLLSFLVKRVPHNMGNYAPREYLRLLESVGIFTKDTKKHISFSKESESKVSIFFDKYGIKNEDLVIGIAPSVGNSIKQWPPDRFGKLADHLIDRYKATIFLIGSPKDVEKEKEMLRSMNYSKMVVSGIGEFSIDELKSVISKFSLFISVDTGPIYIAEALGIPTVDIVGPVNEAVQPPVGDKNFVVIPYEGRVPQLSIMNARVYDREEALKQVMATRVEDVIKVVDQALFKFNKK